MSVMRAGATAVPTREIRELRLNYKLAFTRYMNSVRALSAMSLERTAPPAHVIADMADELRSWKKLADASRVLPKQRSWKLIGLAAPAAPLVCTMRSVGGPADRIRRVRLSNEHHGPNV
jgi:hypothetical protein